ncbi:MAG: crossover junction endodeoxyribonuclease RuvC [Pseudomonadota bacterium]
MVRRILGLDPGLRRTGWGIVEIDGSKLGHIAHGLISPDTSLDMAQRLSHIFKEICQVIDLHQPQDAAVEKTFVNNNPTTTLKLGEARGVVLLTPAYKGLKVSEYTANQIKKSVVGTGHATKEQMKIMMQHVLPTCGALTSDTADALATAVCHAHFSTTSNFWNKGIAA